MNARKSRISKIFSSVYVTILCSYKNVLQYFTCIKFKIITRYQKNECRKEFFWSKMRSVSNFIDSFSII